MRVRLERVLVVIRGLLIFLVVGGMSVLVYKRGFDCYIVVFIIVDNFLELMVYKILVYYFF